LRGAKRRGNLYQVVVMQNEAARQRREIATPSGLAMTVVLCRFAMTLVLIRPLGSGIALQRLYDQV